MQSVEVAVPGGYDDGGRWCRKVRLRPWCGQDEAVLLEDLAGATPVVRATTLLARCLASGGEAAPPDPTLARALSLGDREALLLHLRRITLGDRLSCVLACPACGARLELDLRTADLILPPYEREGLDHEARLPTGDGDVCVRFRLPNGGDQEAAASLAGREDERAAVRLLVSRCVRSVVAEHGEETGAVPPELVPRLSQVMAERDPQAEIRLDAVCPDCRHSFAVPFDSARYVQEEMAQGADELFREVHALASHYHWTETDILAMTSRQRHRYLSLIAEAKARGAAR
jgi:hypothetical protein